MRLPARSIQANGHGASRTKRSRRADNACRPPRKFGRRPGGDEARRSPPRSRRHRRAMAAGIPRRREPADPTSTTSQPCASRDQRAVYSRATVALVPSTATRLLACGAGGLISGTCRRMARQSARATRSTSVEAVCRRLRRARVVAGDQLGHHGGKRSAACLIRERRTERRHRRRRLDEGASGAPSRPRGRVGRRGPNRTPEWSEWTHRPKSRSRAQK